MKNFIILILNEIIIDIIGVHFATYENIYPRGTVSHADLGRADSIFIVQ